MSNSREAAKGAKNSEKLDKLRVFAPSRATDRTRSTKQGISREAAKGATNGNTVEGRANITLRDKHKASGNADNEDEPEQLRVFAPSRETDRTRSTKQGISREAAKDAKKSEKLDKLRVFAPSREIKTDRVHDRQDVEQLSAIVVDCAYKLHVEVGPGLLESVYEAVLARMIEQRGAAVRRQVALPFQLMGMQFNEGFRLDLLVGERLVVELKSVERTLPVHAKQLLTYLRLADLPLGLLINFGAPTFKEGIKRIVNRHQDFASSRLRVNQGSMTEDSP